MGAIVVVTTVGDENEGNLIARELVGRRHAACVNMISGVRTIYRWKGKICRDSEYLLIVKTMESEFDAVSRTIRELHSYELPEVLAFNIGRGDASFLDWVEASLDKTAAFEEEEDLPELDSI
jgi:periplasmic divalent cation tolerance protein